MLNFRFLDKYEKFVNKIDFYLKIENFKFEFGFLLIDSLTLQQKQPMIALQLSSSAGQIQPFVELELVERLSYF